MLPKFTNYAEGPDSGYEALQDFFLSWTLRCSPDSCREGNPKLQEYARRMVYFLIHGNNDNDSYYLNGEVPDSFRVVEVRTKRQKQRIDLLAEIDTTLDGVPQQFVFSIENKWYSPIRREQLRGYRQWIDATYVDQQNVHLVITCDTSRKNYEQEKQYCRETGYKYLTVSDIGEFAGITDTPEGRTNNAIFDEYWLN